MEDNDYLEVTEDKSIITLEFEDGSIGSIQYFANGGSHSRKNVLVYFVTTGFATMTTSAS